MNRIKYTSGTLQKDGEYYTLILFHGEKQVYSGMLSTDEAAELIDKSNKIKLV